MVIFQKNTTNVVLSPLCPFPLLANKIRAASVGGSP